MNNKKYIETILEELELYDKITKLSCEKSLEYFIKEAWPIIEPGREFISNWHITSICKHLEAVTAGKINRLIINVPPGTTKSTIVSVLWPVWGWIKQPSLRFLTGSHNDSLAIRDSLKARIVLESQWFQSLWGDTFSFRVDQNKKTRYENDKTGYRVTFGMQSGVTGEKGDIITIDDPHDAKKAMTSDAGRLHVTDTYDLKVSNRTINPASSAIVIIMQRLHMYDLTGHLLNSGEEWEHLCFPMEFEKSRKCKTLLGIQDIRTEDGELLWPERFTRKYLKVQKDSVLGSLGYSGQMQQEPFPPGGNKIKRNWFNEIERSPEGLEWKRFWDLAVSAKKSADYTASICCAIDNDGNIYIKDMIRGQWEWPETKSNIIKTAIREKVPVGIEEAGQQKGFIDDLLTEKQLMDYSIEGFRPDKDKLTRALPWIVRAEAGKFYIVKGSWVNEFLNEAQIFTGFNDKHDDQIDAISGAYQMQTGVEPKIISLDWDK